jgi:hypothetical protein
LAALGKFLIGRTIERRIELDRSIHQFPKADRLLLRPSQIDWLDLRAGQPIRSETPSALSVNLPAAARLASRMSFDFEELDYRPTPIGVLSLRRRRELKLGVDVFEIKLGDQS